MIAYMVMLGNQFFSASLAEYTRRPSTSTEHLHESLNHRVAVFSINSNRQIIIIMGANRNPKRNSREDEDEEDAERTEELRRENEA